MLGSIETIVSQQASDETEVLERKKIALPEELKALFGSVNHVFCFKRLRSKNGTPHSYALNYVVPEFGSRIRSTDLRHSSMTQVLHESVGAKIVRIDTIVEARLASPEIAQLLDIHVLSPVLYQVGQAYDRSNRVVDLARIYYRGDRYKYIVNMNFDHKHRPRRLPLKSTL